VTELAESGGPTTDHPGFSEVYQQWREPYNAGEAGVFTIPLNEILDVIEQAAAAQGVSTLTWHAAATIMLPARREDEPRLNTRLNRRSEAVR
jgi:hypothetical protein